MIFGHFGADSVAGPEFVDNLARLGHKVLLSHKLNTIKSSSKNIYLLDSLSVDEIASQCDGLCPNGEVNTAKYAYLCKKYNFIGIEESVAKASIDKVACENILRSVKDPKYKLSKKYFINLSDDDIMFKLEGKFPLIVKPSATALSVGVSVVFNKNELEMAINFAKDEISCNENKDIIFEEFIIGDEFALDGIIVNGEFFPLLCLRQRLSPFPYRNEVEYWGGDIFGTDKVELINGINTYTKFKKEDIFEAFFDACKAFGANNCFVQGDAIVNDNGVYIVDISARPNGLRAIYDALGINRARIYLEAFYGAFSDNKLLGSDKLNYELNRNVCWRLFDIKPGIIKNIPDVPLDTIYHTCNLRVGDKLGEIISGARDLSYRGDIIIESIYARKLANDYIESFDIV